MEQKHILMSALSVGIGVGIGLASGQTVSKWTGGDDSSSNAITPRIMEQEMLNLIVDGRNSNVTFDEFPYYLSEQTRVLLTSAAFVYLKNFDFSKHTRNLAPASRTILLSGPAELYQQMLAKALAHYFEARLLLLDITDFSLKIQGKYGSANKEYVNFLNSIPTHVFSALYLFSLFLHQMQYCLPQNAGDFEYSTRILRWFFLVQTSCLQSFKRSISETTLAQMSSLFGSFSALQPREESKGTLRRQSSGVDIGSWKSEGMPSTLRRNASAAQLI